MTRMTKIGIPYPRHRWDKERNGFFLNECPLCHRYITEVFPGASRAYAAHYEKAHS